MELLFESRTNISEVIGMLRFVQHSPEIYSEPVLVGDTFADRNGVTIYGSVLNDGGRLRMWYQSMPEDWDYKSDMATVAYAESEDGITWTKPELDIVKHGLGKNNLVNLGVHSPNVFIDPDAPESHRYRATGCAFPDLYLCPREIKERGYYTAHSADGLHWKFDKFTPQWKRADVITSIYHSQQHRAIISMKHTQRVNHITRRCIHTAEMINGEYSDNVSALYPDEFDDICAINRGYKSCDYYGMGMLGAGSGTVGFLWNFWHQMPYTRDNNIALHGTSDITLVYQPERGGNWFHMPGRPNFIDHNALPWTTGWINSSSCPVEVGDEHRLYYSGGVESHGIYMDNKWQRVDRWVEWTQKYGKKGITFASWPKWRLFGFESYPEGSFVVDLGKIDKPSELFINYTTRSEGKVCVELIDEDGFDLVNAIPLTGEAIGGKVIWKNGSLIKPSTDKSVKARIHLEVAGVYAYELKPIDCK